MTDVNLIVLSTNEAERLYTLAMNGPVKYKYDDKVLAALRDEELVEPKITAGDAPGTTTADGAPWTFGYWRLTERGLEWVRRNHPKLSIEPQDWRDPSVPRPGPRPSGDNPLGDPRKG